MTLREIIAACEKIYCGSYGVEYIHIPDRKPCEWIRDRFEIPQPYKYSVDEKRRILDRLIWSSSFESFLATKFPNDKRFGLGRLRDSGPWYEGSYRPQCRLRRQGHCHWYASPWSSERSVQRRPKAQ